MSEKYTPGPWQIKAGTDGIIRSSADDRWIAKTSVSDPTGWDSDAANAEFIVRACNSHEDLLAACRAALEWRALDGDGISEPIRSRLIAAIAKVGSGNQDASPSLAPVPSEAK